MQRLRFVFRCNTYRAYCLDMSGPTYMLTFSRLVKPRLLTYRGEPARIATHHTHFTLRLTQVQSLGA